jgi:NADH-quinone oxidoreductase subunit F
VTRPGNYELPLGTPFRELIYTHAGGIPDGRKIRAILPGGASSCLLEATEAVLDTPMDYDLAAKCGAQLGSASVIVVDDSVDVLWLLSKTLAFFCHESCGKCPPCRLGTVQMRALLEQLRQGNGGSHSEGSHSEGSHSEGSQSELRQDDLKNLEKLAGIVQKGSLCGLGQSAPNAVLAAIRSFLQAPAA